jgi:hypothetical protein
MLSAASAHPHVSRTVGADGLGISKNGESGEGRAFRAKVGVEFAFLIEDTDFAGWERD